MSSAELNDERVRQLRGQFPALQRQHASLPAVYFDGPAGTQVSQRVIDAVSHYYAHYNANHGGSFATSRESDSMLDRAHAALADFVGASDPATIAFGQNMTSLTFALSRAVSRTWKPGDEILLTRLDHDANVTPWVMAAQDVGVRPVFVEIDPRDCTLRLDDLRSKLNERTRLVAVGAASNATGTVNPVHDICRWAREVGARTFVDDVHFAPHRLTDVAAWGCDFLACSAYKFFGPHLGVMWGRRELLEELRAYRVRPAGDELPGKWMSGTQSHESIAGSLAAVDYLADLGRSLAGRTDLDRRTALRGAFGAIGRYEQQLIQHLLAGLGQLPDIEVRGITDPARFAERLPTVSLTHRRRSPRELAQLLGDAGFFVWHGNYYALQLTETLGLEPEGMLRIGLVHYNTQDEVDRLLRHLERIH